MSASGPETPSAPAGWYADPRQPSQLRYWDGAAWTQHVAPGQEAGPADILPAYAGGPAVPAPTRSPWVIPAVVGGAVLFMLFAMGVLVAIAIPTFVGARERAQDRAAQASVRNAYVAARTIAVDAGTLQAATPPALASVEPSLRFVSA
ncbi:MAG TPA: DUF2510 domain-containing protein, partial [Solirubrobacteraceae bacterium]